MSLLYLRFFFLLTVGRLYKQGELLPSIYIVVVLLTFIAGICHDPVYRVFLTQLFQKWDKGFGIRPVFPTIYYILEDCPPACIFLPDSPPARSSRRWRQGISLRVPAGRCRSSSRRRAFIVLYLRRQDRFEIGGVEYVFVCPLVTGVLHLAGVHFSSRFSAGSVVSKLAAWNMSSVCLLARVVLCHAGVHLSFCFSAGKIVSPLAAWN